MNPIEVHDGVIPPELLAEAIIKLEKIGWNYGWKSDQKKPFGHWHIDLTVTGIPLESRVDIRHEVPAPFIDIWRHIQPIIMPEHPVLMRCYANAHTYACDGYVHKDSLGHDDRTAVLYLNTEWEPNYAGETVFFDDKGEIIAAVMPKFGRIVEFDSNLRHVGRGPSRFCPAARTIVAFKGRPEIDNPPTERMFP